MKIVKLDNIYDIYDDNLIVLNNLPAKTFVIRFANMKGFYLQECELASVKEKVYGVQEKKVEKVINAFEHFERNLGVILSGDKGIGKSLFAKILAEKAIKKNIPVIIVDEYISGIASYISEIKQEVMVMFDEFDKTFGNIKKDGEQDPQDSMLSLFDGFSSGKKLFVVTCNEIYRLNDYLINRPGRFHYHFRFGYPNVDEIKEYMLDKVNPEYQGEIIKVISFSRKVNLNYDCLRAISYELNQGTPFEEAILDLNIINIKNEKFNLTIYFKNGISSCLTNCHLDLFSKEDIECSFEYPKNSYVDIYVKFNPTDIKFDTINKVQLISGDKLKVSGNFDYLDENKDEDKKVIEEVKELVPDYLIIERMHDKNLHYVI